MNPAVRVACAVIIRNNKVLAVKRGMLMRMAGKWEFPGGKIEPGESAVQCVVREIQEELSMRIEVLHAWPSIHHHYVDFQIELLPFVCRTDDQTPILKEHESFDWLDQKTLFGPDWADADIPIRDRIATMISSD